MRLTNTLRDAFVRAAMDDVPTIDHTEEMRKIALDDFVALLPPKVREVWDDPELRPFLNTGWYYGAGPSVHVPCDPTTDTRSLSKPAYEVLRKLKDAHDTASTKRQSLQSKLRAVAYSCTTRKALVAALPEFEKYLPADETVACRTLPVVANVVADFVKAGWPKGTPKPDAKKATKKVAEAA